MIDQLKMMAEFSTKFVPELMDLCRLTNDPDYDQEGESSNLNQLRSSYLNFFFLSAFCKRGKELFRQLALYSKPCTDLLNEYESKLEKEEMMSHKMNPGKR